MTRHDPMLTRRAALMFAATAAALAPAPRVEAAPRSELIDGPWQRFGNGGDPDHAAWDAILSRHLRLGSDGVALFDYAGASLPEVTAYVTTLEAVDPTSLSRDAAFAYWANLYNAVTIQVVLENWPVSSILRIGGSLFSPGPWKDKRTTVAGVALSLDDIEHGILRPVWGDARVHYAVNCASIGCPNLKATSWRAAELSSALDAAARDYVNHPRGAQVSGGSLRVSSIYDWFQADFGGTDSGVISHLRQYAAPDLAAQLAGINRIAGDDYDWNINAA
ncbi:MAG: DUF547 domain-containing protein [Pseudomonadota bacterium]